ncbi:pentapeptide repeat-containing protein [Lentzea sp. NEAU-D7]|uniref:pentapeptide repeat-containing protein n=1 Tax=Lentzea sp. NEAU-D7 TaxID=2994667 RepID=UPI00224B50DA|nr:pentapeptide repeat-containing protein [Lentzea sp. NEAU-D7]MCX2948140.1 pentapeptide repeat-containing protein [Lentzea sp. NEAU-D7]
MSGRSGEKEPQEKTALSNRAELIVAISIVAVTAVALFVVYFWPVPPDANIARVQLEAVRTALSFGAALVAGVALWLAIRRQRSTEKDVSQKEAAHELQVQVAETNRLHQERVADANERDSKERRLVEVYAKSIEELGSDKAAVRLGGAYALERLADSEKALRSNVLEILCAYLRMPLEINPAILHKDMDRLSGGQFDRLETSLSVREEVQVRIAIQRIIRRHSARAKIQSWVAKEFSDTRWNGVNLDLTGATLIGFDLSHCELDGASFAGAHFVGDTNFDDAEFSGFTHFNSAKFYGYSTFDNSLFSGPSLFSGCTFVGKAYFDKVRLRSDDLAFYSSEFHSGIEVRDARKAEGLKIDFGNCRFEGPLAIERVENVDLDGARVKVDSSERIWPTGWVELPSDSADNDGYVAIVSVDGYSVSDFE